MEKSVTSEELHPGPVAALDASNDTPGDATLEEHQPGGVRRSEQLPVRAGCDVANRFDVASLKD